MYLSLGFEAIAVAGRAKVNKLRVRRENNALAGRAKIQTVVHIAEINRKA